jgi:hypothetical protein
MLFFNEGICESWKISGLSFEALTPKGPRSPNWAPCLFNSFSKMTSLCSTLNKSDAHNGMLCDIEPSFLIVLYAVTVTYPVVHIINGKVIAQEIKQEIFRRQEYFGEGFYPEK